MHISPKEQLDLTVEEFLLACDRIDALVAEAKKAQEQASRT